MEKVVMDERFEKGDYTVVPLAKGEYENCAFAHCDFSGSSLGVRLLSR